MTIKRHENIKYHNQILFYIKHHYYQIIKDVNDGQGNKMHLMLLYFNGR